MLLKKRLLLFISVYSVISLVVGCKKIGQKNKHTEQEQKPVVETTTVKIGDIEETISLTGDIYGNKEVKVYAKVSGKLSQKIKTEGDYIKKDEVIALIDRDEEAFKFAEAEVKSPIDGVVMKYFVDLGESVFPAQPMPRDPVLSIADIDKVKIEVYISEKDIPKVKKSQSARIYTDAYPDEIFLGYVSEVSPSVSPVSRKLKIEIAVNNQAHKLKPGMFVQVEVITVVHSKVVVVPKKAVIVRDGKNVVFKVENGFAKMTSVVTGIASDEKIEITKNISAGDTIIIVGNYGLIDGTKVEEK
ncbi:MAG: efflux RND transporter periplasmic adaptor subunit [Elusimicrobiota bacterium]